MLDMVFEKDGVRFSVTDKAHIDCFRAKGWTEVKTENRAQKTNKEEKTKR